MKIIAQVILIVLLIGCQNAGKEVAINSKEHTTIIKTNSSFQKEDKINFIKTEKNLNKQLEKFIGKTVYIDTWFTRCGSCIKQFKYAKKLEDFFNEKDVVPLYICFGNANEKDKWKELIYKYQLTGYHLFLENKNIAEYKKDFNVKLKESLFHGAPRYLIIDQKGKLIDGFAPRPVKKRKLINIINKSLRK